MDLDTFRYYTRWHHAANARRYRAPADPWRLVHVDPSTVTDCTNALPLNYGLGRIRGGDWDRDDRTDVRDTQTYRSLHAHFADGVAWTDTDLYEWAADRYADGERVRGYDSLEDFRDTRLAYVDALHDAIATDGYRANTTAGAESTPEHGHDPADPENPFETAYASTLEPLVVIARDGDVVWTEGYHRFAIADIVGVDAVPVHVLCRHERWQRLRDAVARDGLEAVELPAGVDPTHPDLVDVVD